MIWIIGAKMKYKENLSFAGPLIDLFEVKNKIFEPVDIKLFFAQKKSFTANPPINATVFLLIWTAVSQRYHIKQSTPLPFFLKMKTEKIK